MINHLNRGRWVGLMIFMGSCLLVLSSALPGFATMEQKAEEIKPEFTREGGAVIAKLIPRAKSSSVSIRFSTDEGRLTEVHGVDFEEAARPDVDHKDFKSALFKVNIQDLSSGADVRLSVTSNFFSKSTEFWVFNESQAQPWMNTQAEHKEHPDLVQEIILTIKDGGSFDADGKTNGSVTVIGGPKDSFWGYALGTLFIRFFGIFLVLSVLMVGMMLSGKVFQSSEQKNETAAEPVEPEAPESQEPQKTDEIQDQGLDPAIAAAIGVGIHLQLKADQYQQCYYLPCPETTSWTQQGRDRIMGVRYLTLNRETGKSKE